MHDWLDHANCREYPGELFFAEDSESGFSYNEARTICSTCPVRADCLDVTMRLEGSNHQTFRFGMWAGLSPRERYNLYRRRLAQ